ncbi:MAG: aminotransferase class I/II-fold pyridoxal phosphate-dependent enzyme [Alphaproteobacteria bacterium]|nr:aminotransferase class I/II-fold pyridoxal phosphate-dependent enzyme [Alphaproteobacteria bacterium]
MHNPRIDQLADYPFDRLRALLKDATPPAGLAPIVLSIGEPQHPAPKLLTDALAANAHLWNRYPPVEGTPELRQAIADWLARRFGLGAGAVDPARHVLPVAGTREALYMAAELAVPERKNGRTPVALMPAPYYHVYGGAAAMRGTETVFLPATRQTGFLPDLDAVSPETWARAAIFYLCSPSNPQGAVADLGYLKRAVELCRRHDVVLASDECYSEIYDDVPPPGLLQACADDDFGNVLVFHSLSKRSSAAGLRSGFVAGDPELIARFKRLRAYAAATIPLPVQAASAALWSDETHVNESRALYRAKFDLAGRILGGRFGFVRPKGGFFLWLDVGDGEKAARKLWAEAALRVLPGAYMSRGGADAEAGRAYIRVTLVQPTDATAEALQRLVKVL